MSLAFLLSIALLVFGLAVLAVVLYKVSSGVRRFTKIRAAAMLVTKNEIGLLKARIAALKVAFRQRWGRTTGPDARLG